MIIQLQTRITKLRARRIYHQSVKINNSLKEDWHFTKFPSTSTERFLSTADTWIWLIIIRLHTWLLFTNYPHCIKKLISIYPLTIAKFIWIKIKIHFIKKQIFYPIWLTGLIEAISDERLPRSRAVYFPLHIRSFLPLYKGLK